jgi:hypothetical protein
MIYTTDIEIETAPGEYEEIEVVVHYDYTPEEKQWFNPVKGEGHPGCPESVDIYKITADGGGILLHDEDLRRIEENIIEDRQEEAIAILAEAADRAYDEMRDEQMMRRCGG